MRNERPFFFVFRVGWPGMENYKKLKVIQLMGEHALPYFLRNTEAPQKANVEAIVGMRAGRVSSAGS
jgi:hypothetical protein